MKFIVSKRDLRKALQNVSQFSNKASTLPSTKDVFFVKKNETHISVACSNLESSAIVDLEVEFDNYSEGRFAAVEVRPLKQLLDVVKAGETGNVLVSTHQPEHQYEYLQIMGDRGHISIACDSHVDETDFNNLFIDFQSFEPINSIETAGMFDAVRQIEFCASNDACRPVLQGIRFSENALVACDGFRIVKFPISYQGLNCIVPAKNLLQAGRLFGRDVIIQAQIRPGQIKFSTDYARVLLHTIDGKFPDYEAIIPKKWRIKSEINREYLLESLSLAEISQKVLGGNNVVKLTFNSSNHSIVSSTVEGEGSSAYSLNSYTSLNVETDAALPFMIAVNANYIKKIVDSIHSKTILLKMNANNTPMVIESADTEVHPVYVLMPMHLG